MDSISPDFILIDDNVRSHIAHVPNLWPALSSPGVAEDLPYREDDACTIRRDSKSTPRAVYDPLHWFLRPHFLVFPGVPGREGSQPETLQQFRRRTLVGRAYPPVKPKGVGLIPVGVDRSSGSENRHFGLWIRVEGAATAAPEAYDQEESPGRHTHPVPLEVLRRRPQLYVRRYLEDSSSGSAIASIKDVFCFDLRTAANFLSFHFLPLFLSVSLFLAFQRVRSTTQNEKIDKTWLRVVAACKYNSKATDAAPYRASLNPLTLLQRNK
ncbi:hypothetical protein TNCV_3239831 [Trichonephila clavipes]|nr:hypothetical protein TNCV_3239831 [Trichonephila clavipes]